MGYHHSGACGSISVMPLNKTAKGILVSAFTYGNVRIDNPMLSLTHRKGRARNKLVSLGLLEIYKQWIDGDSATFNTLCRLTGNGYVYVRAMAKRDSVRFGYEFVVKKYLTGEIR